MENTESRRQFMRKGLAAGAGILGLSNIDITQAGEPLRYAGKKVVVENARKIYSSPPDVKEKYCG